jgi:tRNA modification GTPase
LVPTFIRQALTISSDSLTDNRNESRSGGSGRTESETAGPARAFRLSAVTGEGLEALVAALSDEAAAQLGGGGESVLITRARHRRALQDALDALKRATASRESGQEEIVAEELRLAAAALGRLTGRIDVEDVLDVIFRDFCIGK